MDFIISKIVLYLVLPPASLILLMLAGLLIINRHRHTGRLLVFLGLALLYALSLGTVADQMIGPLETLYPPFHAKSAEADAVVVLAGGVKDLSWRGIDPAPSDASLGRAVAAARLAKSFRLPLVISGGTGEISPTAAREADAMAAAAAIMGISGRDIVIENRSRNTLESAVETARLMEGRRILLVTSAFHLKRSVALFTRQGFAVTPVPADYRAETRGPSIASYIPRAHHLETSSTAIAEYLSLAWYGMRGKL